MNAECQWTEEEDYGGGPWETSCGHLFEFTDAGPDENGFKFCCWCGKPLDAVYWVAEDETK